MGIALNNGLRAVKLRALESVRRRVPAFGSYDRQKRVFGGEDLRQGIFDPVTSLIVTDKDF